MRRIVFHAPDEMADEIKKESQRRLAPISAIVREALEEYFRNRGIEFDTRVEWGKPTEETEDSPSEAELAAA